MTLSSKKPLKISIDNINNEINSIINSIIDKLDFNKNISSSFLLKNILNQGYNKKYTRSKLLLNILNNIPNNLFAPSSQTTIYYCVSIELINIATNIHDSIHAKNKNNKYKILKNKLSTDQAILIGDLIFTIAFEIMLKTNNQKVIEYFAETTKKMALYEAELSEHEYYSMDLLIKKIEQKYWPLFSSIIFFYSDIFPVKTIDHIEQQIKSYYKEYILNKIITKEIVIKENLSIVLYSPDSISFCKKLVKDCL